MVLIYYLWTQILFFMIDCFGNHAFIFLEESVFSHRCGIDRFNCFKIDLNVVTRLRYFATRHQSHFYLSLHQIQSFITDLSAVCSGSKSN
jgi:hypothetical protein